MSKILWQIILQFVLIGLNAIFACAEIAVLSVSDAKLEKLANDGNKKAVKLQKLTEQPSRFLATIQVAITLSGFLGSAFAADNFAGLLADWFVGFGFPVPRETVSTVAVVLITLILSYFTLVFGELVPKRVAMKNAEALSLGIAGPISGLAKIFSPIVWLLTSSTNGLLRLMGIDPESEDEEVTEEEIRMMVDAGSEKGAIDKEEKELIQNVFEFDDIPVEEIATHRTGVSLLWLEETPEQWEQTIHETRHSIYPVCDDSVDNVVGILNAKDYFRIKDKNRETILKEAVTQPYFIPETLKADVLFRNMKSSGNYFAVVIDEYGGMTGIITMNDLVQQLVGDFEDENAPVAERDIERLDSSTWKICGNADIEEVEQALGVKLNREDEFETFGGFVFERYGSIPEDGSKFEIDTDNLHIKVTEIKEHRIVRALVCVEIEKKDEPEEKNNE